MFGLQISAVGESTPLSCMCRVSDKYVFLGSRIADSVLLKYKSVTDEASVEDSSTTMKIDQTDEDQREDFEMLFYGRKLILQDKESSKEASMSSKQSKFVFEEVDRLYNISPQVSSVIATNIIDDHGQRNLNMKPRDSFVDYVTCSGYQNSSSISVLEGSLRSYLLNSVDFQMPVV